MLIDQFFNILFAFLHLITQRLLLQQDHLFFDKNKIQIKTKFHLLQLLNALFLFNYPDYLFYSILNQLLFVCFH